MVYLPAYEVSPMDEWEVERMADGPRMKRDLPEAYAVHVSEDMAVIVLRAKPTGSLWCTDCARTSREGCAHIDATVRWIHARARAA